MKQSNLELTVGVFVLIGLAAVAYLALKIGGRQFGGGDTYVVHARFSNASGVSRGANVLISGVPVGQVEAVRLDETTYAAIVDLRLDKKVQLSVDSIVAVKSAGLIGEKSLSISPGVEEEIVAAGGMLTETVPGVDIESLIGRIAFGGQNPGGGSGGSNKSGPDQAAPKNSSASPTPSSP